MTRRKFLERTSATAIGTAAVTQSGSRAQGQTAKSTSRRRKPNRKIVTDRAPRPAGPYSQAIVAGNTIYVAGQVAINPRTGQAVTGDFEQQAAQVFENVKSIVEAAGATLADVVRVGVYLADLNNFAKMNEIYKRFFAEDYPARTTVGVQLPPQYQIEVDCIVVKE